ncbi:MAG: N-6 DNA methylase [Alphaproteobacteria bacterium]
MKTTDFLASIKETYNTGIAREHAYRPAIQQLINALAENVMAINEPARVQCGAPDFIVNVGEIPVGHIEAKDIDVDISALKGVNLKQFKCYAAALPNLVYTNGLDWDFYRDGEKVASISIADFLMGVQPKPENFDALESLLREFIKQRPLTITSPRDLAERMAGKAQLIKNILGNTLVQDKDQENELTGQYEAFKENLIHDITPEDFADIYAETVAYGMFAARLHDNTPDTFSRQEALELLPKSNPFLRNLFSYVAGVNLDDRIAWIIDDLALVFKACDVASLMEGFGKFTGQRDPFLHFYETFLAAYNPAKKKARGVWYTPEPVVNFIVRAVDEVLQAEFGLPDGLADTSKVTIDWETGQTDKKGKPLSIKKDVHRVQILDPPTGTGTFLAEAIKQIAPKVKNVAPGMWSQYIEQDLIPRLHGFEILMASYAMCHMKLDMMLTELGYKPTKEHPRLSVFLTNSPEEGEPANQTLPFTQWLSREAKGANSIKRDMPIMCVIGNPPYSGISQNMGA